MEKKHRNRIVLAAVVGCILIAAFVFLRKGTAPERDTAADTDYPGSDFSASAELPQTAVPDTAEKSEPAQQQAGADQSKEDEKMNIQIGDTILTAVLEHNVSADAFKALLENGELTIQFSGYGGFEQVGAIGTNLPRNDVQMTTAPGDIVLYSGNQLVMFYGSNSWAYTKIGTIEDTRDLQSILSKDRITAVFTLSE